MSRGFRWVLWILPFSQISGPVRAEEPPRGTSFSKPPKLIARIHDSGFALAHDTFNGISRAGDGRIYYVLSSASFDVGAQMYVFDPATSRIRHIGDLTEACGEKGLKTIVQGKSHVKFVEHEGKLYFATHVGYYSIVDGVEKMGVPPPGFKPYSGGHFLAYDTATGKFEDFGIARAGEGVLAMNMDMRRGRIYGLTWPTGEFIRYDLTRRDMKDLGPFFEEGESGKGPTYRTICRCIAIDPRDGSAYFTRPTGEILRYKYDLDAVEPVVPDDLKKDYFGQWDPSVPGHMGYNWRQVVWHPAEQVFYGVHGNSGYLFRFDPQATRVEVLDRITSEPSKRGGMFDQFQYGYLGFELGPDGRTLYYLTGGPVYDDERHARTKHATTKPGAAKIENMHLVTYDIPTATCTDHGAVFFPNGDRPASVNSIAVGKDGTVYALSKITENGHERTDLISIEAVLKNSP